MKKYQNEKCSLNTNLQHSNSKVMHFKGKRYEMDSSIKLNENNLILPNDDTRNYFRITLFDNILFYHDNDLTLNQNDMTIKGIIKQITLNTPFDSTKNNSLNIKTEILVTKINKNELKFERLSRNSISKPFSLISKITSNNIQNEKSEFPKLKNLLANCQINQKKSSTDYNNNNFDFDESHNVTKQNNKKYLISNQVEKKIQYTPSHPKPIIPSEEKAKILNYIGISKTSSKIKNNIINSESSSKYQNEKNEIKKCYFPQDQIISDDEKLLKISLDNSDNNKDYINKPHLNLKDESSIECCTVSIRRSMSLNRNTLLHKSTDSQPNHESKSNYDKSLRKRTLTPDINGSRIGIKRNSSILDSNALVKEYFRKKQLEWKNIPFNLIDSHCHFDMLFTKIKFDQSINEYFDEYGHYYLDNFEACINVICDPYKFFGRERFRNYLNRYTHQKVYFTVGCHPHFAQSWNKKIEDILFKIAEESELIAIGECGLDISKKNNVSLDVQLEAFIGQLLIARYFDIPVVIHCRETEKEVYEHMKKHLSPKHRIHLHCFTGNWEMAKLYLDTFKNLYIGVTPLVTFQSKISQSFYDMVKNIPINRLLLETDSPYFLPRLEGFPSDIEFSHPGFVFATAEAVAKIKDVSLESIIINTRSNVRQVYGI